MRRARLWKALACIGVAAGVWRIAVAEDSAGSTVDFSALASADPKERTDAIDALVQLGSSGISSLQTALEQQTSADVKAGIAQAMLRIGLSDGQIDNLKSTLLASDPGARLEAVNLIAATKPSRLRDALIDVAKNASETAEIRAAAADALGGTGDAARETLLKIVSDKALPWELRRCALRALPRTGVEGTSIAFEMADPAHYPADVVAEAIAAVGHPDADSADRLITLSESSSATVRAQATGAILAHGSTASGLLDALATCLSDDEPSVRIAALRALAGLKSVGAKRTEVAALLEDSDASVQAAAAELVGGAFKDSASTVTDKLKALLDSSSFPVRYQAALALLALGSDAGKERMKSDKDSSDPSVKAMASKAYDLIDKK